MKHIDKDLQTLWLEQVKIVENVFLTFLSDSHLHIWLSFVDKTKSNKLKVSCESRGQIRGFRDAITTFRKVEKA